MSLPAPSVVAALEAAGLTYRVITHTTPVHSLAEAAAARGVEIADIVKTLVVRRGEGDYLFILVPGGRAISWPKLRALLGISRMSMPPADEAFEATGFVRGTITPLGSRHPWPIIADVSIASRHEVTLGSGAAEIAIGVDAKQFLEVMGATVADVTEPEPASL